MGGNGAGGASTAALVQQITQMLANNAQGGGLGGLIQSFERMGLGNVISSWISTGQNLPISPDQLQQVLGQGRIGQIAQSLGLHPIKLRLNCRNCCRMPSTRSHRAARCPHKAWSTRMSWMRFRACLGSLGAGRVALRNTRCDAVASLFDPMVEQRRFACKNPHLKALCGYNTPRV
jgi:hypothetical protein